MRVRRRAAPRGGAGLEPAGWCGVPDLGRRERLLVAAYYYGAVSSGWCAERLGLEGRVEFWDWLRDHGLPMPMAVEEEELVLLRTWLWEEGVPQDEIDRLTGRHPAVSALLDAVSPVEVAAFLRPEGAEPDPL